jgi:predicted RNA-binding Zn-ribbon protein involved in translation (DUF1610 family)
MSEFARHVLTCPRCGSAELLDQYRRVVNRDYHDKTRCADCGWERLGSRFSIRTVDELGRTIKMDRGRWVRNC